MADMPSDWLLAADAPERIRAIVRALGEGGACNARRVGSMVADVQRILIRGGVFLYPEDITRQPPRARLHLMYEANPMAHNIEAAGGTALCGGQRMREVQPVALHQQVAVAMGSRIQMARLAVGCRRRA